MPMTDKEVRMLTRLDMLEVLARQERENERLRLRIAELERLLSERAEEGQAQSGDSAGCSDRAAGAKMTAEA